VSVDEPPRYRFGPRDRRGLVAGARAGQVVVVCATLVAAVGLLRWLRGGAGAGTGFLVVLLGVAVSCWPVRGRTVEEWMPVAGRYAGELLLGRRSAVLDRRAPGSSARAPGPLAALQVQEIEGSGVNGAFGALHDRRSGTWTAVLSLGSEAFALLDERDRARRVAAWSGVLAAVSGASTGVHRLQWVERTLPDRGEALRRHLELRGVGEGAAEPGPGSARRSYAELLEREAAGALRHELFLACTVRTPSARCARLAEEVARLDRRCRDAAIPVDGVLSSAGLSSLLRRSFDALPATGPASWPWPVAIETSWSSVRTDGTWHATYWIAEWPRSDVTSDFLLPLLVGCGERRSVSVVMSAVPPLRAIRAAEHARTSTVADAELRRRHGFATSARRSREHDAVVRREGELAEGHAAYRFSGYVTVTVGDPSALEAACARVEQAAALARVELRRLYGSQGEALAFTLPTGRGCA
jgi:hypothetical protein